MNCLCLVIHHFFAVASRSIHRLQLHEPAYKIYTQITQDGRIRIIDLDYQEIYKVPLGVYKHRFILHSTHTMDNIHIDV